MKWWNPERDANEALVDRHLPKWEVLIEVLLPTPEANLGANRHLPKWEVLIEVLSGLAVYSGARGVRHLPKWEVLIEVTPPLGRPFLPGSPPTPPEMGGPH